MIKEALFESLNLFEEKTQPYQKGFVMGRTYIKRGHIEGHKTLMRDDFSETPVYSDDMFRRRFRMKRDLFLEIAEAIKNHDSYFEQKVDAVNRLGLSTLQKVTAAIRQLAYGSATGEETTRKDVERAFGVLQARFAMVQRPARMFKKRDIETVMNACIILHNKIVENERSQVLDLG